MLFPLSWKRSTSRFIIDSLNLTRKSAYLTKSSYLSTQIAQTATFLPSAPSSSRVAHPGPDSLEIGHQRYRPSCAPRLSRSAESGNFIVSFLSPLPPSTLLFCHRRLTIMMRWSSFTHNLIAMDITIHRRSKPGQGERNCYTLSSCRRFRCDVPDGFASYRRVGVIGDQLQANTAKQPPKQKRHHQSDKDNIIPI